MDDNNIEIIETTSSKKEVPKRLVNLLFGTVDIDDVGSRVLDDIIMPSIATMLYNSLDYLNRRILFPSEKPTIIKGDSLVGNNVTDYNGISKGRSVKVLKAKDRKRVRPLSFESRIKAVEVLDTLRKHIRSYGRVSVAILYDEVGIRATTADTKYGWYSLGHDAYISESINDGKRTYVLYMPEPEELD